MKASRQSPPRYWSETGDSSETGDGAPSIGSTRAATAPAWLQRRTCYAPASLLSMPVFPSICVIGRAVVSDGVALTGEIVVADGDVDGQEPPASCCCTPSDSDTERTNMPEKQSACVSSRRMYLARSLVARLLAQCVPKTKMPVRPCTAWPELMGHHDIGGPLVVPHLTRQGLLVAGYCSTPADRRCSRRR